MNAVLYSFPKRTADNDQHLFSRAIKRGRCLGLDRVEREERACRVRSLVRAGKSEAYAMYEVFERDDAPRGAA